MKRKLISLAAVVLVATTTAQAQAPAASSASAAVTHNVGPTVSSSVAGIRAPQAARSLYAAGDAHMGAGQNVALMVVGAAALIIGAAIEGTAGLLIAVAGAVVGLYGLYHFIQ